MKSQEAASITPENVIGLDLLCGTFNPVEFGAFVYNSCLILLFSTHWASLLSGETFKSLKTVLKKSTSGKFTELLHLHQVCGMNVILTDLCLVKPA